MKSFVDWPPVVLSWTLRVNCASSCNVWMNFRPGWFKPFPSLISGTRQKFTQQEQSLGQQIHLFLHNKKHALTTLSSQLQAFSPLAVLERGYAIVTGKGREIVRDPDRVEKGDTIGIRVERGEFRAKKI